MRIIGGDLRGKMISPPIGYDARPTTDFAKEGLFNVLMNMIDFEDVKVLDLFSGTGSISFEFASRGCKEIISCEMNPAHVNFIKRTAKSFGLSSIRVLHQNVFDFLEICNVKFDLIFADPPYALNQLENIPDNIFSKEVLSEDGIFILEHPSSFNFEKHPHFFKEKKYGNVHFSFFK